jgi:hypothetical protein
MEVMFRLRIYTLMASRTASANRSAGAVSVINPTGMRVDQPFLQVRFTVLLHAKSVETCVRLLRRVHFVFV